jgi:hypothetical protein
VIRMGFSELALDHATARRVRVRREGTPSGT